jgi:hypothetical protein
MVTPRLFSLGEANALVPTLSETFTRARVLRDRLGKLQVQLGAEGHPIAGASVEIDPGARPEVQGLQRRAVLLLGELLELIRGVAELGIEVKQADGLCDFRSRHEGRLVFLCWKFGEERITHFHELGSGYAGRKPLPPEGRFAGDPIH